MNTVSVISHFTTDNDEDRRRAFNNITKMMIQNTIYMQQSIHGDMRKQKRNVTKKK